MLTYQEVQIMQKLKLIKHCSYFIIIIMLYSCVSNRQVYSDKSGINKLFLYKNYKFKFVLEPDNVYYGNYYIENNNLFLNVIRYKTSITTKSYVFEIKEFYFSNTTIFIEGHILKLTQWMKNAKPNLR